MPWAIILGRDQSFINDDPICLDDITLLHEDCRLRTSNADEMSDSAQDINNTEEGVVPTVGM